MNDRCPNDCLILGNFKFLLLFLVSLTWTALNLKNFSAMQLGSRRFNALKTIFAFSFANHSWNGRMLSLLRRAKEGASQGACIINSDSALLNGEHGIGITNKAVTPYAGTVIHHSLYKSIVEHLFTLARDVRNSFERLRRPCLLQIFFLVFSTCSFQVMLLSR